MTPMSVPAGAPAPRWLVGAVAVLVASNVAVAGGVVVDRTESRLAPRQGPVAGAHVAARAAIGADTQEVQRAVIALLGRRATAVRRHDITSFMATVDPLAPQAFKAAQRSSALALRVVPLSSWTYELDPDKAHDLPADRVPRYGGAATWSPDVLLSYQIAGFDPQPTVDEIYPTFVQRSGQWYLGAVDDLVSSGLTTQKGPWDFGPLLVTRTRSSIVFGHKGSTALARLVGGEIDRAVPRVDAVWRRPWAHKAVVILPATQQELETLIDEPNLDQIAAVATAESAARADGTQQAPVGDRVMVNPKNFRELGPLGRRVVLTHELTHIATRSSTAGGVPSWLVEGFADYVGYLGAGVPVKVAASELADDLDNGTKLKGLPTDDDFEATNPDLAQAYEGAWLANRLIAERVGPTGLAALYAAVGREASQGADVDEVVSAALEATVKLTLPEFTAAWRSYVRRQLR
ncbi:MAG: hypothetical protein QOK42_2491 [Frankiaceae bacterium]|nr:hypothetical protein [Frankiaceae bacterium]MDX6275651.1 hypothetical protein [Frankiales bacterium]